MQMIVRWADKEKQFACIKLKNRRISLLILDDESVVISTKKLITRDEVDGERSRGYKVRGRIAELDIRYSKEAFEYIVQGYLHLTAPDIALAQ